MVKIKVTETTEKYDDNGHLVEKIIREETIEDDTIYYPLYTTPITSTSPVQSENFSKKWEPSWCYKNVTITR